MLRLRLTFAVIIALAIALGGCESGSESGSSIAELPEAVEGTITGGPVAAVVSTVSPAGTYVVDGNLDPAPGRLCGKITQTLGPDDYGEGGHLYLSTHAGNYSSVIKFERRARERMFPAVGGSGCEATGWFDDHPPTLALFSYGADSGPRYPEGAETGAESYMQLALLALTEFDRGAGEISDVGEQTYQVSFDFPAADEVPEGRNEDRWGMEPLIKKTAERPVEFSLEGGHVTSISFAAPGTLKGSSAGDVEVELALGAPGSGVSVPVARVSAME